MSSARPLTRVDIGHPTQRNAVFSHFEERLLESPEDLRKSFRLRYEVYCEEMMFLPLADYPDGIETDGYDERSLSFGSFNRDGAIVGTVRLVLGDDIHELPMSEHCELHPEASAALACASRFAEVSRLAVNRQYRRRATDGRFGLWQPSDSGPRRDERRQETYPTVVRLYRVMYHALKQRNIEHIVAAMEVGLYRMLRAIRFPFREIGPEVDYYGPVQPFYLNLNELDCVLSRIRPDLLRYFNDGLDARLQYHPPIAALTGVMDASCGLAAK